MSKKMPKKRQVKNWRRCIKKPPSGRPKSQNQKVSKKQIEVKPKIRCLSTTLETLHRNSQLLTLRETSQILRHDNGSQILRHANGSQILRHGNGIQILRLRLLTRHSSQPF